MPTIYIRLIEAGEPFRLLFPLGAAMGVLGVMLWPAHLWWGAAYPIVSHAGIMIQCFLASFVIGFLGTALPRLLDVSKFRLRASLGFAGLIVLIAMLHLCGRSAQAEWVFLLLMLIFVGSLLVRARRRKDIPPPGFVLVLMGLLSALLGVALQIILNTWANALPPQCFTLGKRLLQQGFLLLPIMGIGAFLLPRFFGLPSRQNFPESLKPPPGWWPRAAFAAACGCAVIASFFLEAWGLLRAAWLLRAAGVLIYFYREVPVHQAAFSRGSLAWSLRIALASIPIGYLAMALLPARHMTLVHIVFITGFTLLTFTVATRVVLGHSGQSEKFARPLKSVACMAGLFVLAMATRVSADWMPELRMSHYAYASLAWSAAVAVWAIGILPGVRRPDAE
ncbi:MAG: NnrS family protein [Opitutales bacterium]